MNTKPATGPAHYVALLPLLGLWIALGLLLSWLAGAGRLGATRVSVTVALLVLATGMIPALLRPARLTLLAGWIATLLACIVIAPLELSFMPGTLPSPALLHLPGGTLLRLVCSAMLGPAFVQFSALLLAQKRPSYAQTARNSAFGLLLAAATLGLPPPFALIAAAALVLWFAAQTCIAILRLLRARTQQARLLLATILAAELPLLLRPALAAAGLPIPYELLLVTQLVLPLGISYAITRHNLFAIDSILRRAFGYTLLSVAVLALYLGVSAAFTMLLAALVPAVRGLAVLIGLFAAAAAFTPLHTRAQQLIDAALYPERIAFRNALQAAHRQLAQVVQRAKVIELLQHQLPDQLGAVHAHLNLGAVPTKPAEPGWSSTLQVAETTVGHYQLGPRRSGLPYDPDEQAQLAALLRQAALALAYAETLEQLQRLNQTLEQRVGAQVQQLFTQQRALLIAAERQRLARDLHDSATQTLFSINLGARAIRNLIPAEAHAARQALIEQEQAARQALNEMRELLNQLRAPIEEPAEQMQPVIAIDLAAELRKLTAELQQRAELEITLDTPASALLPEPLATGLAMIAREALTNVRKHSGVHTAQITLSSTPASTLLCIIDHGCGFLLSSVNSEQYGLRGMRERAAAFGGSLEVVSSAGQGTMVRVSIQESGVSLEESEVRSQNDG